VLGADGLAVKAKAAGSGTPTKTTKAPKPIDAGCIN
jgi:hypothetical protein